MDITYNFTVDAWITDVEITGRSEQDCERQLLSMTLADILDAGYVRDFTIKDIDSEITLEELLVEVTDIEYDEDDAEDRLLPTTLELRVDIWQGDDEEEAIRDAIYDEVLCDAKNFNYTIKRRS